MNAFVKCIRLEKEAAGRDGLVRKALKKHQWPVVGVNLPFELNIFKVQSSRRCTIVKALVNALTNRLRYVVFRMFDKGNMFKGRAFF